MTDPRIEAALAEIGKKLNEPRTYYANWYGGGMQDAVNIFLIHMAEPHPIWKELRELLNSDHPDEIQDDLRDILAKYQ
jgi:hypothetical protein